MYSWSSDAAALPSIVDWTPSTIHSLLEVDQQKRTARLREISWSLQAIDQERGQLEREAHGIKMRQEALTRERHTLACERAALGLPLDIESFLSAPIRRIPTEILTEIFMWTQDPTTVDGIGRSVARTLSHVSTYWRAVACGVPRLWSSFSVPLFGQDPDAQLLTLHLDRSGDAPLTIHVDSRTNTENETGEREMQLLAKHAPRLYRLCFVGHPAISLEALRGNLPRLEILEFVNLSDDIGDAFKDAPSLHSIKLWHMQEAQHVVLPGRQIRTLTVDSGPGLPNTYIEQLFPNLTSLVCAPEDPPRVSITMQDLEDWQIRCSESTYHSTDFFNWYTTPSLRRLQLTRFERGWSSPDVLHFLQRSRCDLTELTIEECPLRATDILDMSLLLPNLVKLVIKHATPNTLTDKFMEALTLHSNQPARLPKLATLHIDGSYLYREHTLLEMLESHTSRLDAGLHTVELVLRNRAIADPELARFRALEGIHLSLFCLDGEKRMYRVMGGIRLPALRGEFPPPRF
ncbi:hypothetical protein B0H11DRAFT_872548 [Mycena galericulata]|nr:hypothetical protein B0H11DRAFT_872548 [Mycena galericulata]